ncbi:MAG: helix-turn-helix domain-containing protein [Cyanobacteria bacterium J06636_16]
MKYKTYKPSSYLSNFVKYYWQFELNSIPKEVLANRVIPSGEVQIIFHYKTPFREVDKNHQSSVQPQFLICGQQTEYKDVLPSVPSGMLAVVFHPYALKALFPNPINEFTNKSISLDNFFQAEAKELQERIVEANDIYLRIALVEEFLLKKLFISDNFALIKNVVNIICNTNGQLAVNEIANELNISKRQFERIFLASIGISPKKFGRIVRFSYATKLFKKATPLTNLAHEAGYFDQSHLIRDFREFTGFSPKDFFSQTCCTPE